MNYRYMPFYVQGSGISGMYYGQSSMDDERDMNYVKEMYPKTFAKLQEIVDDECDRQEFAGSMMFDEYPDKIGMMRIRNRVFDRLQLENVSCVEMSRECQKYPEDEWVKDIIMVLLLNEMCRRRRQRRRYY